MIGCPFPLWPASAGFFFAHGSADMQSDQLLDSRIQPSGHVLLYCSAMRAIARFSNYIADNPYC